MDLKYKCYTYIGQLILLAGPVNVFFILEIYEIFSKRCFKTCTSWKYKNTYYELIKLINTLNIQTTEWINLLYFSSIDR